jgi:hypothetical protein
MQQVTQQSTHLFARVVLSNFEPCTLLVLAEVPPHLANRGDYFRNNDRFGGLAISLRKFLYVLASENMEATVSNMVDTVFASTAKYRVVRQLKVDPKLRSRFGTRCRQLGNIRWLDQLFDTEASGLSLDRFIVLAIDLSGNCDCTQI